MITTDGNLKNKSCNKQISELIGTWHRNWLHISFAMEQIRVSSMLCTTKHIYMHIRLRMVDGAFGLAFESWLTVLAGLGLV